MQSRLANDKGLHSPYFMTLVAHTYIHTYIHFYFGFFFNVVLTIYSCHDVINVVVTVVLLGTSWYGLGNDWILEWHLQNNEEGCGNPKCLVILLLMIYQILMIPDDF
jgi:hypothetical protein